MSAQAAKLKQAELKTGQLERQLEIRVCIIKELDVTGPLMPF